MQIAEIPANVLHRFRDGCAMPALPLALNPDRSHDERHQRAIIRYYIDAGVGGLAVGVHSTQFEIRDPDVGLFEPVLRLAAQEIDAWSAKRGTQILKIAGVCGATEQALNEARTAIGLGYHACLLSLSALRDSSTDEMLDHCRRVAAQMPVVGFYLQPAVGGRVLPYEFWREFARIDGVLGIKIAPFNRYRTFDVVRAVCDAERELYVTLYTGNDDNIVVDLLTPFQVGDKTVRIRGGLLGHWGVWTRRAVELLSMLQAVRDQDQIPTELLTLAAQITDANAAIFDAANDFRGCIPGIHEILRRQGLMSGVWCLDPGEALSPGQAQELDRVSAAYPDLVDDSFVREHLEEWLR